MTQEQKMKLFATDLRRILYLCRILLYSIEWMRLSDICPSYMKTDMGNMQNSIKRLFADMMHHRPDTWEQVKSELSKDELHDLSLLIDSMQNVANIAEIVEIIESCKTQVV